jgi:hypothetical protein
MKILVLVVMIAMAIIGLVSTMSQSIDAWHSTFGSKEDCLNWFTNVESMTKPEANDECQKILGH